MQIAQAAQGTGLGTVLLHQGIVGTRLVDAAHHLVADGNLIEHAAVAGRDKHVAAGPLQAMQVLQRLVVPTDDGLVGRQLLHVEQGTQILAEATIDTFDVGVAAVTVGRADGET